MQDKYQDNIFKHEDTWRRERESSHINKWP